MEKKGINLITLFFIIIIVAIIGMGVGYFITRNLNNGQIVKEGSFENEKAQTEKNIEKENENSEKIDIAKNNVQTTSTTNTNVETLKYDGSKNIVVNGKTYVISYKNESYFEESEKFKTTIYINGKKLKTFKNEYKFKEDCLEIVTILGDKEYLAVSTKIYAPSDEEIYVFIINQEEEVLDTIHVHEANIGISIDNIYSHKIYENNMIFFKRLHEYPITKSGEKYSVAVYKVTVENDNVMYKLERLCTNDEVIFSGK